MLYDYCAQSNVPYKKTGKLVIAQGHQRAYIESLHEKAKKLQWPPHSSAGKPDSPVAPTFLISGDEARDMEPDLSKDIVAALYSPETGIVDSHSLMESLHKDISDSENGNAAVVLSTKVVRIDPYAPSTQVTGSIDMPGVEEGWVVQTVTGESDESDTLLARHVINTSGLSANLMLNSLLPLEDRIAMYFARGSYASYRGPGVSNISRLLYPVPDDSSKEGHSFQSLGTHLTIDMEGNIKFGPDLEWLDAPKSDEANSDFWERHLVPNDQRIADMHREVTRYLPGVQLEGMQPDYAGIRPKLVAPPHGKFHDFAFRTDYPSTFLKTLTKKERAAPMITLLGIESPGLTSSLAIAELVVDDMLQGGRK
jgi:2-hydroxyglutarate dehydrogenase